MKFAEEIAQHVKLFMYHPELSARNSGRVYWVKKSTDTDYPEFVAQHPAYEDAQAAVYTTIQAAVNACTGARNEVIFVSPGSYAETVTVAFAKSMLQIIGLGNRGAAYIDPTTEDAGGMLVHANDVSVHNLGIAAEDDTAGNNSLVVTGSRFRAYGCKLEGGEVQALVGPGTVAQETAGTHGRGGDIIFYDCEFAWGTKGLVLQGTDYGGATQVRLERCYFHNLTTSSIDENVGTGGSAAVTFFNFRAVDCDFDDAEDGTAPTKYIDLDGDNANSGVVTRCSFPTAINSGKNTVSTALHWVSNFHTGGVSTGQPS